MAAVGGEKVFGVVAASDEGGGEDGGEALGGGLAVDFVELLGRHEARDGVVVG